MTVRPRKNRCWRRRWLQRPKSGRAIAWLVETGARYGSVRLSNTRPAGSTRPLTRAMRRELFGAVRGFAKDIRREVSGGCWSERVRRLRRALNKWQGGRK